MNGGTPPLAPDNNRVRPCKVILPKLSVDIDTAVKSEELSAKDSDIYLEEGQVTSQAQVMAMSLAQNQVLVLSGAQTSGGAGTMVTAGESTSSSGEIIVFYGI